MVNKVISTDGQREVLRSNKIQKIRQLDNNEVKCLTDTIWSHDRTGSQPLRHVVFKVILFNQLGLHTSWQIHKVFLKSIVLKLEGKTALGRHRRR